MASHLAHKVIFLLFRSASCPIFRLTFFANLHIAWIRFQTLTSDLVIGRDRDKEGDMRALSDEILRIPPRRIGDSPLFVTRQGKAYIDKQGRCNAFDSLWQRFMDKVMAETKVVERFQERDLRAKVASDSDSLIEASERLGHADTAITQRVYRRKPVRIQPLKKSRGT